ncbi:MAG: tetratricopeptide repeat protein [Fluviicola sp.]|nr:tetratricopeptide repeat protein [Fluviicola sp.]
MATLKIIISCSLFAVFSMSTICAQSDSIAGEYMRLADDFKKNAAPDSAIVYYEKASVEFQQLNQVEQFVSSCNQIGVLLTRQDNYEEAKVYLNKALVAARSSLDTNNPVIANTYIAFGVIYSAEENFPLSLEYHQKALAIRLLKFGKNHADVATSYGNIGNVYFNSSNYEKAIENHLKALKVREKLFGKAGVELTQSYTNLGNAYRESKNYKKALLYFDKALTNKIKQVGDKHKDLTKFYKNISDVYYLKGDTKNGDWYKTQSEELSKS